MSSNDDKITWKQVITGITILLAVFGTIKGGVSMYDYVEDLKKQSYDAEKSILLEKMDNFTENASRQNIKIDSILEKQIEGMEQYQIVNSALAIISKEQEDQGKKIDEMWFEIYDDDGKVSVKPRRMIEKRDKVIQSLSDRMTVLESKLLEKESI